ncbi:MAG: hypothetical protein ACI4O9_02470 [Akkermansia sp.]
MNNRVTTGREYLENLRPGSFADLIDYAVSHNGIVHLAPDCLLIAVPCEDAPRTLHVLFQCSQLCALCKLLLSLEGYDRVRYRRDFRNNYDTRERDISTFARHLKLGYKISPL